MKPQNLSLAARNKSDNSVSGVTCLLVLKECNFLKELAGMKQFLPILSICDTATGFLKYCHLINVFQYTLFGV